MDQILESGAKTILLHKENLSGIDFSIIYNTLQKDPCNSEKEAVVYIYRQLRASEPPDEATARDVIEKLFFSDKRYDLGDVGRYRINKKLDLDIDPAIRTLTREDIIAIIKYLIQLINSRPTSTISTTCRTAVSAPWANSCRTSSRWASCAWRVRSASA